MAILTVSGTVSAVSNDKYNYVKFWETYEFKGQERHRIWTAWFENTTGVFEGDWIQIEGSLGTKVGKYQKPGEDEKQVVEHSLNDCGIIQHQPKHSNTLQKEQAAEPIADFGTPIDPASAPF